MTSVVRIHRTRNRWLIALAAAVAFTMLAFCALLWGHLPSVWSTDRTYSMLQVGDSIERVEQLMGQPHERRVEGENVRFIYRVFPPFFRLNGIDDARHEMYSIRWQIELDQGDNVISMRRTDSPC